MRDPLADLNARLRKLGLQPISMGGAPRRPDIAAMYQRPISKASPVETQQALVEQAKSSGPMYNQLTPEAEEGVLEKIGGGLLSGLQFVGETFDHMFGGRAIRGLLSGKPRELLSAGPLGLISDRVGLTKREDYTGGREMLESWGVLGENEEGLDWGDTAGFLAEVLLDPGTFIGGGLVKGTRVLNQGGKALGKSTAMNVVKGAAKYDDVANSLLRKSGVLDTPGKNFIDAFKRGEEEIASALKHSPEAAVQARKVNEAAMASVRLTESQLITRIKTSSVLEAAADVQKYKQRTGPMIPTKLLDNLTEVLDVPGVSSQMSAKDILTSAISSLHPTLEGAALNRKISEVGAESLGATFEYGVPTLFSGANTNKGIRKTLLGWLPEKAKMRNYNLGLNTRLGKGFDSYHRALDLGGKKLRGSWLGLQANRVFNPKMLWDARTLDVQEDILEHVRRMESSAHQGRILTESMRVRLAKTQALNIDELMKQQPHLSKEAALVEIERNRDAIGLSQEGWQFKDGTDTLELPEYDLSYASVLARMASSNKRILKGLAGDVDEKALNEIDSAYTGIIEGLKQANTPDQISQAVDEMRKLSRNNPDDWALAMPSSVVEGRVSPRLPASLADIKTQMPDGTTRTVSQEIGILKDMGDEAFNYSQKNGINIERLTDDYALYDPRTITKTPKQSLSERIREARDNKNKETYGSIVAREGDELVSSPKNLNPITGRQHQRQDYLRNIKGGTWTLNRWFKKYGQDNFSRAQGKILEKPVEDVIAKLAKDEHWIDAAMDEEYLLRLLDDGVMAEVTDEAAIAAARDAGELFTGFRDGKEILVSVDKASPKIVEIGKMLAEGNPDAAGKGMRIYAAEPIKAATDYYEDVMRAGTAAKLVGEIAATHAYARFSDGYNDLTKTSNRNLVNLGDLFTSLDMDTVIAKRNVLQRFKTHNPEEWAHMEAYALSAESTWGPEMTEWFKNPGGFAIGSGDRVSFKNVDELYSLLAKQGIETEEQIAKYLSDNNWDSINEVTVKSVARKSELPTQNVAPVVAATDTPVATAVADVAEDAVAATDTPVAQRVVGEGVDYSDEAAAMDEAFIRTMDDQAPVEGWVDMPNAPPRLDSLAPVKITHGTAKHIVKHGVGGPELHAKFDTLLNKKTGSGIFELNPDEIDIIEKHLNDMSRAVQRYHVETRAQIDPLRKAWNAGDYSGFNKVADEIPASVADDVPGYTSFTIPLGTVKEILALKGIPKSLRTKLNAAQKAGNKERGTIRLTPEEIEASAFNKTIGETTEGTIQKVQMQFVEALEDLRKGKAPLPKEEIGPLVSADNMDELVVTVPRRLQTYLEMDEIDTIENAYRQDHVSPDAVNEMIGDQVKPPELPNQFVLGFGGGRDLMAEIERVIGRTNALAPKVVNHLESLRDQLGDAITGQKKHWKIDASGARVPVVVDQKNLSDIAKSLDIKSPDAGEMVVTVGGKDIDVFEAYIATTRLDIKSTIVKPEDVPALRSYYIDNEYSDDVLEMMTEKANSSQPAMAVTLSGGEVVIIHGQHRIEKTILENIEAAAQVPPKPQRHMNVYVLTKEQVDSLPAPKMYDPHSAVDGTRTEAEWVNSWVNGENNTYLLPTTGTQGSTQSLLDQASSIPGFGKLNIQDIPTKLPPTRALSTVPGNVSETVLPKISPKPAQVVDAAEEVIDDAVVFLTGIDNPIPRSSLYSTDEFSNSFLKVHGENLFQNMVIDPEIGGDLTRYLSSFVKHDVKSELQAATIWFTDLFKQYATSMWPAFHVRNVVSGFVNSMYGGAFDPDTFGPMRWIKPYLDAKALRKGNGVEGLGGVEYFKGRGLSDEAASQEMIDGVVGGGLLGPGQHMSDTAVEGSDRVGSFLNSKESIVPSINQAGDVVNPNTSFGERLTEAMSISEKELGGNLPGLRQLGRGTERVRAAGYQLGNEAEYYLRMAPVIAYLRKGMSLPDAIAKVKLTQVDYKALSQMERHYFRRIIPFYTFTRRQIPFVLEEISNPSSGMSMMTKGLTSAKRSMEDPNEPIPDWISTGVSMPLGKTDSGMNRYLTNMGGMIGGAEDVFSLLKPGHGILDTAKRIGGGLMSRANPLLQAPVEHMADYSFFHQRPFSEMKSPTARLIGQVTGTEQLPKYPSVQLDALLSRLPGYGRAVSTARSLTDWPRRPIRGEDGKISVANVLARTVPALSGVRVTDTDLVGNRNKLLQERIEEILRRNPNVSKFSKMYVPENRLGSLSPEELEFYLLYKKLGSEASKASHARRKAAAYSN